MSTNQPNPTPPPGGPTLSAADQDAIMTAITTIRQKLPFLTDLTAAESKTLSKLGDKSHAFVNKAVDVAAQNPGILPASHSLDDVRNSAQLFQGMAGVSLAIEQLYKQVHDTTIKTGSDAYAIARTIYAATKSPVANPNLKTAADSLGKRFGRKPKAAAATTAPAPANSAATTAAPAPAVAPAPAPSPAPAATTSATSATAHA